MNVLRTLQFESTANTTTLTVEKFNYIVKEGKKPYVMMKIQGNKGVVAGARAFKQITNPATFASLRNKTVELEWRESDQKDKNGQNWHTVLNATILDLDPQETALGANSIFSLNATTPKGVEA